MIIVVYLLIAILVGIVLGMESEGNTPQAQELIPLEIPVNEVAFYHRNRS
jgi:hypothetical protein